MAADPIQELGALYRQAAEELKQRAMQRLVKDANTPTAESLRARMLLGEVDQIIAELDRQSAEWVGKNAPQEYWDSVSETNARLRKMGATLQAESDLGSQIHQDAVQVLVNSMQIKLLDASANIARGFRQVVMKTQLRGVLDREIKKQIGLGIIEGKARREVSNAIKQRLISEFADRPIRVGGATFSADTYAELVARTMTREAATVGTVNRLVETGEDLVQVTDTGATDACAFYEGQVFSISGTSDKYPALASLPNGGPPFHPNCTHGVVPFIEDLASKAELEKVDNVPDKALGKSFKEVNKLVA